MRKLTRTLSILGLILGVSLTAVQGQPPTIITLDEHGFGTWFPPGAPGPVPIAGVLGPDPSGGVAGPVLIYTIPGPPLILGDVLLTEGTNSPVSDVVRFWFSNQVIFYSDREAGEPNPDPADSGLPGNIQDNNVIVVESGPEGTNSAGYVALGGGAFGGKPGWDGNPTGTDYQIISDSIPEPGLLCLTSFGGLLLLALSQQRRRAARS